MAANQTKAWFEANRATYDNEVRHPAVALVEAVSTAFAEREVPLSGDAKKSLFRINRDVRFSKDKSPYKTHAGIVWTRPGGQNETGVAYAHIADEGCFVAAGFYGAERPQLDAIREAIRYDGAGFTAALSHARAAKLELDLSDSMTRMPRGFEDVTDPALIAAIKARHLVLRRSLTKREASSAGLVNAIVTAAEAALPFLRFGWDALAEDGPAPAWSKLR